MCASVRYWTNPHSYLNVARAGIMLTMKARVPFLKRQTKCEYTQNTQKDAFTAPPVITIKGWDSEIILLNAVFGLVSILLNFEVQWYKRS